MGKTLYQYKLNILKRYTSYVSIIYTWKQIARLLNTWLTQKKSRAVWNIEKSTHTIHISTKCFIYNGFNGLPMVSIHFINACLKYAYYNWMIVYNLMTYQHFMRHKAAVIMYVTHTFNILLSMCWWCVFNMCCIEHVKKNTHVKHVCI